MKDRLIPAHYLQPDIVKNYTVKTLMKNIAVKKVFHMLILLECSRINTTYDRI